MHYSADLNFFLPLSTLEHIALTKYISIQHQLKEGKVESAVKAYIPQFILRGQEKEADMQMRMTAEGLRPSEIDDILKVVNLESKAHARRTGKTKLSSNSKTKDSP